MFQRLINFSTKHALILLIVLSAFLAVFRAWENRIPYADELNIEDASYTMVHGGSWIIPTVGGNADLAKPPFVYWVTAPFYIFLSPIPITRRMPTIIFGILLVFLVFKLSEKFFNKTAAVWAGLFLATSIPFLFFTKTANFDLPNAFLGLLLIYFYNLGKKEKKYLYLAGIILGAGILGRSALAIFSFLTISLDYILSKKRQKFSVILICLGLAVLVVLPWHLATVLVNPKAFLEMYLGLPIFQHALGNLAGDFTYSPFYYLRIFLIFPPTILAVIHAFWKVDGKNLIKRQMTIFSILIFVLLSVSSTRHDWYIFPIYPAFAILAGGFMAAFLAKTKKDSVLFLVFLIFIVTIIVAIPAGFLAQPIPQADSVSAVDIMKVKSSISDTLFLWRYPFVTKTRFFPNRNVETVEKIDDNLLQSKNIFVLARTLDLRQLPNLSRKILFQSNEFTLLEFTK